MRSIIRPATTIAGLLTLTFCWFATTTTRAASWPTYRGDAARSGYTSESLPDELALHWSYEATEPPSPAWPRSDRMTFDRAMHPVVDDNTIYFGSSADGKLYALDSATGQTRWTYQTDGPIRFAPALWRDRIFATSDDGNLYCLSLEGKLLNRWRGGADERMRLGNEQMISRWPARGGVAIVDDVVYYAAGIWPSEGIYLYAIDATGGDILWKNEDSGSIYMPQPHGGAEAKSGVSAQGYLVASGDNLLVPTGRAVPAVFDRSEGKLKYFHLQRYGHRGGAPTMAVGDVFFNSGIPFETKTGTALRGLGKGAIAAAGKSVFRSTANEVSGYHWVEKEEPDRKGKLVRVRKLERDWALGDVPGGFSLIVADDHLVVGGRGTVSIVDPQSQKTLWSAAVNGVAYGLAVADGRLYVSTNLGHIHCFASPDDRQPVVQRNPQTDQPYPDDSAAAAAAAAKIVELTGVTEGYCVDLGCGDGALAFELAKRTNLRIYAIEADPNQARIARDRLTSAGLYGARVTIHVGDPAKTNYPNYFADLVVSGRSVTEGTGAVDADEAGRLQRPYGGVACVGREDEMKASVRGELAGAGSWTHQYSNAANTCCSTDTLVKGKLEMLWFRDVDLDMPQRHGRGPAPLFYQGKLIVEGLDELKAVDAYNGRSLWQYSLEGILQSYDSDHLMGTAGTHSNICIAEDSVYVRVDDRCMRIDVASGEKLAEFTAPPKPNGEQGTWGYLACEDGILFGSLADEEHVVKWRFKKGNMNRQFTESVMLFALDARSGKLKWRYDAADSIRHNAIAIGGGRVYLIDRPSAEGDHLDVGKKGNHPTGRLIALAAESGKGKWQIDDDIYGTLLSLSVEHDALMMGYQPTRFRLPSEVGGRLAVFRASNGERLWDKKVKYASRPLINDKIIYAQGGAWDLVSGENRPFNFSRSYGCGILAGSVNMLVYRSATLGYFDLNENGATENYGGVRPGCWINAIPAGGLVLVPDASAGCQCSYLNKAWFALQSVEK